MLLREPKLLSNISIKKNNFFLEDNSFYFINSRNALAYLLQNLHHAGYKHIVMPDYNCNIVADVIAESNIKSSLYRISNNFNIDNCYEIPQDADIFLFVNYFGYTSDIPIELSNKIKSKKMFVIADNAHSYSKHEYDKKNNTFIDASFTSLSKSLPVPYGSILYIRSNEIISKKLIIINIASYEIIKRLYLWLVYFVKKLFFMASKKRKYLNIAYVGITSNQNFLSMPRDKVGGIQKLILNHLKIDKITETKDKNYKLYTSWAKRNNLNQSIKTLDTGCFPSYFVIHLDNKNQRDELLENFLDKSIDAFPWPLGNEDQKTENSFLLWESTVLIPLCEYREF